MVLVFIFIGILLLIATVIMLNTFSTIRITIKNFYVSNYNKPKVNKNIEKEETIQYKLPFGGGAGRRADEHIDASTFK